MRAQPIRTDVKTDPSRVEADFDLISFPGISGDNLRWWRKQEGITQRNLADLLHVSYPYIGRWESDLNPPPYHALRGLFMLGAPVVGGEKPKPPEPTPDSKYVVKNPQPPAPDNLTLPSPKLQEIVTIAKKLSGMNLKLLLKQAQMLLQRQSLT